MPEIAVVGRREIVSFFPPAQKGEARVMFSDKQFRGPRSGGSFFTRFAKVVIAQEK